MPSTVLSCIQQASAELGLPVPIEVAASRETQVVQMKALLNSAGNELVRAFEWQFLRRTATITLEPGKSEYPLPTDFSKMINQTIWEQSNVYSVHGPVSTRQWAYLKNSVTIAPDYSFIIKQGQIHFNPAPGANGTPGSAIITYEYISNGWVADYDSPLVYKSVAEKDNDTVLLEYWLTIKLLKLKMWEAKGLDTTTLRDDFMRHFNFVTGQDHGAQVLPLVRRPIVLAPPIPPETGFGYSS